MLTRRVAELDVGGGSDLALAVLSARCVAELSANAECFGSTFCVAGSTCVNSVCQCQDGLSTMDSTSQICGINNNNNNNNLIIIIILCVYVCVRARVCVCVCVCVRACVCLTHTLSLSL